MKRTIQILFFVTVFTFFIAEKCFSDYNQDCRITLDYYELLSDHYSTIFNKSKSSGLKFIIQNHKSALAFLKQGGWNDAKSLLSSNLSELSSCLSSYDSTKFTRLEAYCLFHFLYVENKFLIAMHAKVLGQKREAVEIFNYIKVDMEGLNGTGQDSFQNILQKFNIYGTEKLKQDASSQLESMGI